MVVMCVLLGMNVLILALYLKKIDVIGFLKRKILRNKNSTEYEELLK
jgi:hypothetical protein